MSENQMKNRITDFRLDEGIEAILKFVFEGSRFF